jgi:glycosyltransferase involved in cell wall biosynthesis
MNMSSSKIINVLHIITDLDIGGAEKVLTSLVVSSTRSNIRYSVISLKSEGEYAEEIRTSGIDVYSVGMKKSFKDIFLLLKLARLIRIENPDIVQTWMYHADFIGGMIAKLTTRAKIVWNIRHSDLGPEVKISTKLTRTLLAKLSGLIPSTIVTCSKKAKEFHVGLGYKSEKFIYIPNGINLQQYKKDRDDGIAIRKKIDIKASEIALGVIARFHPQKDHRNFISAANKIAAYYPKIHFVLCGNKMDLNNDELTSWIGKEYLDRFHLLGKRTDMPQIMSSLDILVSSSSHGEAFPNVVAEAMANEVPCVVTDVGDSAEVVGDTGIVVSPSNPLALEKGISAMIDKILNTDEKLGQVARKRVIDLFSLKAMKDNYEDLYSTIAS